MALSSYFELIFSVSKKLIQALNNRLSAVNVSFVVLVQTDETEHFNENSLSENND